MTDTKRAQAGLERLTQDFTKSYGADTAAVGGLDKRPTIIPTGSLTLDYELGTGGWPLGYLVGVFGPRDIGKSSVIGLNMIREAQALGLVPAIIAMEPNFDKKWAEKHGVDTETLFVAYPESGEEAFAMLHKLLKSEFVDVVLFDSIGSLVGESEIAEDGKPRQGGQASLITWGVKVAAPLAYRNNKLVILLNQVRDNMASRIPGVVQQPGGKALEHHESIIVQLKRGKDRYMHPDDKEIEIGSTIVAQIVRNKMAEGKGKKAMFDFYSMEVEGYPFGIDKALDVLSIGKRTGVITTRGAWHDLPNGKSFNGAKATGEYLQEHSDVVSEIRELVLAHMRDRDAHVESDGEDVLKITPKKKEKVAV